jgi:general secretion pathway protein A
MYEKFFLLERPPFSIVPDPNCVHLVGQHADAISGLAYGVMSRKGYLVLAGEAGLGKTTALGAMANLLSDANVQLSVILNPILTAPEFLEMVLLNFGFVQVPASKTQRLKMLHEFLIRSDCEGKTSALIVDEAHKLSADLLEEVRLLGNFEASDHKLLQIVLMGQDELNNRLNLPEMWQLKQRIVIRMSLRRLDRDESEQYLRFRWRKAGGAELLPFTDAGIDAVAAWSHGIPRLINSICDNALLIAFAAATQTVDVALVHEACVELDLPTPPLKPRPKITLPMAAPQPPPTEAAPQLWQYSGASMLDQAATLVQDERGGIPYRAVLPRLTPVHFSPRVLLVLAYAIAFAGISIYIWKFRGPAVSTPAITRTPESPLPATKPPAEAATPEHTTPPLQIWVGSNLQQSNLIRKVPPVYPEAAAAANAQGTVRLSALIGTDGRVRTLKVVGGTPELIQPAMDAVKQWVYRPLLVNGDPVEVMTEIDVAFPDSP